MPSLRELLDAKRAKDTAQTAAALKQDSVTSSIREQEAAKEATIPAQTLLPPEKLSGFSAAKAKIAPLQTTIASIQSGGPKINATTAAKPTIEEATAASASTGPSVDMEQLRRNLDYLAANIEQKELVGGVVRTIAMQLRNMPELGKFLQDDDFNLIVRGLRRAFNVAARAKTEKRAVRAEANQDVDDLSRMMKDMGISL